MLFTETYFEINIFIFRGPWHTWLFLPYITLYEILMDKTILSLKVKPIKYGKCICYLILVHMQKNNLSTKIASLINTLFSYMYTILFWLNSVLTFLYPKNKPLKITCFVGSFGDIKSFENDRINRPLYDLKLVLRIILSFLIQEYLDC